MTERSRTTSPRIGAVSRTVLAGVSILILGTALIISPFRPSLAQTEPPAPTPASSPEPSPTVDPCSELTAENYQEMQDYMRETGQSLSEAEICQRYREARGGNTSSFPMGQIQPPTGSYPLQTGGNPTNLPSTGLPGWPGSGAGPGSPPRDTGSVGPDPRFPDDTHIRAFQSAAGSLGGASYSRLTALMPEISNVIREYADYGKGSETGFPQSSLKCSNPATEAVWKADSILQIGDLPKFVGCFEPQVRLDLPLLVRPCLRRCAGGFFARGCIEVCDDPPPGINNCCASNDYVLEECGAARPRRDQDFGYHLTFWWPENTAQINNYEVASFDPTYECNNLGVGSAPDDPDFDVRHSTLMDSDLYEGGLRVTRAKVARDQTEREEYTREDAEISDRPSPERPNVGQSHWAGIQPGDQTFHAEAHVTQTYLNTLGRMNSSGSRDGYRYNCSCFYNLIDHWDKSRDRIHTGWTELPKFLHHWRFWQLSEELGQVKYEAIRDFTNPITDLCASYRAYLAPWSNEYRDLIDSIRVEPPGGGMGQALSRICYRGGGELFPINGNLIGHFSPLPAAAYIARRAFYLFGRPTLDTGAPWMPAGRRMNRYSDNDDKMQRIYPKTGLLTGMSQCFRGHEIPNYLREGDGNWPRDLVKPAELETNIIAPGEDIRYTYWNKRSGCMCPFTGPIVLVKTSGSVFGGLVSANGKYCEIFPACRTVARGSGVGEGDYEDDPALPLGGTGGHDLGSISMTIPFGSVSVPGLLGDAAMGFVAMSAPFPFMPDLGEEAWVYELLSGRQCRIQPRTEQCSARFNYRGILRVGGGGVGLAGAELNFGAGANRYGEEPQANICLPEWMDSDGGLQCDEREERCD